MPRNTYGFKPYAGFAPTAFDSAGAFLPDRQNWLVMPVSQARDSGPLDKSNFDTFLAGLGGKGRSVEVHRFGHWGPGWFELILVSPGAEKKLLLAASMRDALEDYPVLSEDD